MVTKDFVLVHVPKTGVTFLNGLIRQHCEVLHEQTHAPYSELPADYRGLPALAFVRDPWQWYVSWFEHYQHFGPDTPNDWAFNRFWIYERNFALTLDLCFKQRPDYYSDVIQRMTSGCDVRRHENLREEFVAFLHRNGIENPVLAREVTDAPPANVGQHRPYRSYYNEADERLVARSWVARTCGYEFLTFMERQHKAVYQSDLDVATRL